jgi:hypothetical protein
VFLETTGGEDTVAGIGSHQEGYGFHYSREHNNIVMVLGNVWIDSGHGRFGKTTEKAIAAGR